MPHRPPPQPRIHILGLGNLGRLFAHALASQPNPPPITLLFHRSTLLTEWDAAGRQISITTNNISASSSSYDIEVIGDHTITPPNTNNPLEPIQNLILTTKSPLTLSALTPISHRLNQQSSLLFAQNGLGTTSEITSALFPNPSTRPAYLAAIVSHGLYSTGPFASVFAGQASIKIGPVLKPGDELGEKGPGRWLLDQVVGCEMLKAREEEAEELRMCQLEKLTVNAVINPLTSIFHLKNGELFSHPEIAGLAHSLVAEASGVLLAQSSSNPSQLNRFSKEKLEELVRKVATKTGQNTSSMLQDVQAGRGTEIKYINGWFVQKGKEMGVKCGCHERLMGMVLEGRKIGVGEVGEWFPDVKM